LGLILNFNVYHNLKGLGGRVISFLDIERIGSVDERIKDTHQKDYPMHNDVPKNRTFLLPDQPLGEANATRRLISKIKEVAFNAKIANRKANPPIYQQKNYTI
jgi:hypothetical protein